MPYGQPTGATFAAGPDFVPPGASPDPAGWGPSAVNGAPLVAHEQLRRIGTTCEALYLNDGGAGDWQVFSPEVVPESELWNLHGVDLSVQLASETSGDTPFVVAATARGAAGDPGGIRLIGTIIDGLVYYGAGGPGWWLTAGWGFGLTVGTAGTPTGPAYATVTRYQRVPA